MTGREGRWRKEGREEVERGGGSESGKRLRMDWSGTTLQELEDS